ncbi:MAG: GNAT family N-acetyltransferase [Betaproteobacteria bacterium]
MLALQTMAWEEAKRDAAPIRFAVFVEEQKVPAEMELDDNDAVSLHVVASDGGRAVGTGRLLPDGHIGRMAVLRDARGRGVGAAMLVRLMEAARERGDREVVLEAQTHALGFYRKHGFIEEGSEYLDAGIPHRGMRRRF